jgi:hypothetical protein
MFLFNMLVSWYKAVLYSDTKGSEGKFYVTQSPFEDSHAVIGIRGQDVEVRHEIELGPPVSDFNSGVPFDMRKHTTYWDKSYVMLISNKSSAQGSFYLAHTFGRSGDSALNVDIPLPSIEHSSFAFEGTSGDIRTAIDLESVPWDRHDLIWSWIKDYVVLNRLENAFAATFELFSAISSQPMPSYHESAHWHKSELEVHLPMFTPCRARLPANLIGEAYTGSSDAIDFQITESNSPRKYLLNAAIINYTMWMGLYAVVDDYARDMSDWRIGFRSNADTLRVLSSIEMRAAMASSITGKEVVTCMNRNAFLTIDLSPMCEDTTIRMAKVKDTMTPETIALTSPVPYVSGSLILGAVSSQAVVMEHLHGTYKVQFGERGFVTPPEALRVAQIYRIFGHYAQMQHMLSKQDFNVFAPATECVLYPPTLLEPVFENDKIYAKGSIARLGRHDAIPVLESIRFGGTLEVAYSVPNITVMRWQSRTVPVMTATVLRQKKAVLGYRVRGNGILTNVRMLVRPERVERPGFHTAGTRPAPVQPIVSQEPVIITQERVVEEADLAEDVP